MYATEGNRKQKRQRRCITSALVALAAFMVDLDSSMAFSPASDNNTKNVDRRRNGGSKISFTASSDDASFRRNGGTDLHVAMAPEAIQPNIYPVSVVGKVGTKVGLQNNILQEKSSDVEQKREEVASMSPSSRTVSLHRRKRSSRMARPRSLNSSARVESRTTPSKLEGTRLSKDQERKLTLSIRSLRKAVRVRDELVEHYDRIPTELEWAEACDVTALSLRRIMYEGQQARTLLVTFNAGLVISIAKRHFNALKQATEAGGGVGTILTLQDLVQEGNLGLMQAAERFEAERGHRFSTYATYWIKQRILRSISDSSRIIRLPAHVHSMLQKISKAKKEMVQQTGQAPTLVELAHYMEIPVEELQKQTSRTRNVVSLESPLRSGGSMKEDRRTIGDVIMSDAPTPEEDAQCNDLKDDIRAVINELPLEEKDVVMLRFGLENGEPMTVKQTGKELGLSTDRIRSLEARALNKLRSPQRKYRLKDYVGGQADEETSTEEVEPSREKIWFF